MCGSTVRTDSLAIHGSNQLNTGRCEAADSSGKLKCFLLLGPCYLYSNDCILRNAKASEHWMCINELREDFDHYPNDFHYSLENNVARLYRVMKISVEFHLLDPCLVDPGF